MAKCGDCGVRFDVEDARDEYNSYPEFGGEFDYDEEHGGSRCGNCATSETESNYNRGLEITALMNGDDEEDAHWYA